MISIQANTEQIAKLKDKFENYPPYAINAGLNASADYLNQPEIKSSIYPPSQAGSPFIWSSDRQRRAFFATNGFGRGIPTVRTNQLAESGTFRVDQSRSSLYVFYQNIAPYAKWVIGQFTQIVGHIARGWKPVNTLIVDRHRGEIVRRFKDAALRAWNSDEFMSGGGGGL